jgi:hypothetical protein
MFQIDSRSILDKDLLGVIECDIERGCLSQRFGIGEDKLARRQVRLLEW